MTFQPINALSFQIPISIAFDKDHEKFIQQVTSFYELNARATNSRTIGINSEVELLIGDQLFTTDAQLYTQIFRKVIEFGALPNVATRSVAHGISGIGDGWRFTKIEANSRDTTVPGAPVFITIPNSGASQAEITVDNTNINISSAINLSAYTSTLVFLEYAKV